MMTIQNVLFWNIKKFGQADVYMNVLYAQKVII